MTSLDAKIIGRSKPAIELKKMISLVAGSDSPVIIKGPTGSGKELVAEALHDESRRKGDFIALNCAAIPSELMEAEIFGFEKGAFTGAIKTTLGKFEQAHKGTLFLDEIGDMPPALQTKLLRVLENSTISRVGSTKEIKLDVRIICATHKDLDVLTKENIFREDLLFRLNVFPIEVPSLKARSNDVPALIDHFVKVKTKGDSTRAPNFQKDAFEALKKYHWPGNIREVRNVVERSIMFFPAQSVSGEDVNTYLIRVNSGVINRAQEQNAIWSEFEQLSLFSEKASKTEENASPPNPTDFARWFDTNNSVDLRTLLRDIEIVLIEAAMNRNDNNTSEAAKDLRNTLTDANATFVTSGVKVGQQVVNTSGASSYSGFSGFVVSVDSETQLTLSYSPFGVAQTIGDSYGVFSTSGIVEVERVNQNKIFYLNNSPLTAPSTGFPAYVLG